METVIPGSVNMIFLTFLKLSLCQTRETTRLTPTNHVCNYSFMNVSENIQGRSALRVDSFFFPVGSQFFLVCRLLCV